MNALTHEPEDVILRDGTTLRLRPPLASDAEALLDFMSRLSDRSRYLRFHGFPQLAPKLVTPFLDPDWDERGALIGCFEGRIVALANYARLRDRRAAEVAFTVEDEFQGRGIATRMLERLVAMAAEVGIEEFVAEVLPENRNMLVVFRDAGFDIMRELGGGEVEVRFPIAATEHYRDQVAARNHVAVTASLKGFFEPTCVAVIGASARRGSIGGELFRNVLAADFAGAAYPINRGGEPVAGVRGYTRVGDIPDRVELAVVCLPGEHVLAAVQDALEAGVRAVCVISAGFAEIGAEGRIRQEQLIALIREHGARLVGPNCLGIASAAVRLNATFAPRAFPAGKIGFSSQSGALGLAVLERADASGLGLSSFISIGNKADVSSNDLLEWWEDDPGTEIVMLYLESFGNPRAFARIARRVARTKPILAVKGGTTRAGIKAASSHTAALAGSDTAVDALFRQAGVIRTRTLDELIEVASLLAAQPVPRGSHVALLTNAGGLGILAADACEAAGLELPALSEGTRHALAEVMPAEGSTANPVDMLGSANAKSFRDVLPIVLADPGIDAVIALFVPTVGVDEDEVGAAISSAAADAGDKTVLCAFMSAKGAPASLRSVAPVPSFSYPEAAVRALARAAERGAWLRRPAGTIPELDVDLDAAQAVVAEALGAQRRGMARAGAGASAARGLRASGRPGARGRLGRRGGSRRNRAGLPGGREERGRRRPQDGVRRCRAEPRRRGRGACRRQADRSPGDRPADDQRRRRAARRRRPGSRLRPARRIRPRRRPRGADRAGAVPPRPAHRPRREGAGPGRQGRPPGRRLPRQAAGRRGRARRPDAAPVEARRGDPGSRRAGPQPGPRPLGPLHLGGRKGEGRKTAETGPNEDLVNPPEGRAKGRRLTQPQAR